MCSYDDAIRGVLDANPEATQAAAKYIRSLQKQAKIITWLVGRVMRATRGTAPPLLVRTLVCERLGVDEEEVFQYGKD